MLLFEQELLLFGALLLILLHVLLAPILATYVEGWTFSRIYYFVNSTCRVLGQHTPYATCVHGATMLAYECHHVIQHVL